LYEVVYTTIHETYGKANDSLTNNTMTGIENENTVIGQSLARTPGEGGGGKKI